MSVEEEEEIKIDYHEATTFQYKTEIFTLLGVNTGDFFEEWNEITPQIHTTKF